jgi:hypothetical protein
MKNIRICLARMTESHFGSLGFGNLIALDLDNQEALVIEDGVLVDRIPLDDLDELDQQAYTILKRELSL